MLWFTVWIVTSTILGSWAYRLFADNRELRVVANKTEEGITDIVETYENELLSLSEKFEASAQRVSSLRFLLVEYREKLGSAEDDVENLKSMLAIAESRAENAESEATMMRDRDLPQLSDNSYDFDGDCAL